MTRAHPWDLREIQFLMEAVLVGEADGEPIEGQRGVAWVVRNRVERPGWWGRGWTGILLAPGQFACFWADFELRRRAMESERLRQRVRWVADGILRDPPAYADLTYGAVYYCPLAGGEGATPRAPGRMERTVVIGRRAFFRPQDETEEM